MITLCFSPPISTDQIYNSMTRKGKITLVKGQYLNETILYIHDKDFIYIIVVQGHVAGATPLPTPTSTENRPPDHPKQPSAATGSPSTFRNPETNERSPESRKSDRP